LKIIIIAAVDKNGCIGKDTAIPWHNKEDFAHFRKTTIGHPVIMGRKTLESMGKALPERPNIVLSRSDLLRINPTFCVQSIEQAFEYAEDFRMGDCFIIGGAEIYKQTLSLADEMIITHMNLEVEDGDTFFPEWPIKDWVLYDCVVHKDFDIKKYRKRLISEENVV